MSTVTARRKLKPRQVKPGLRKHGGRNVSKHLDLAASQKEAYIKTKIGKLNDALDNDPVDVERLRRLMISDKGCVTDDMRCKVWPKLLNVDVFNQPKKKKASTEQKEFQTNVWWRQVNLDVDRSHKRMPLGERRSRKRVLQQQLTNIIMRVLLRHPQLHYYQGYHDIAVTLLRVLGEDLATTLLEQLSVNQIRDFMDVNMHRTNRMLSLFYAVLGKIDAELEMFLTRADVGTVFALSWLITWYGHDINGFESIVRLFDFFLATHPAMPVYMAVVLVKNAKKQILEEECDMPMVYRCLCRLPSYVGFEDVDGIIKKTHDLYQKHPPGTLRYEVRRHIKESDSFNHHAKLLDQSYNQRPDRILRHRKRVDRLLKYSLQNDDVDKTNETDTQTSLVKSNQVNPLVKVAVWTMTLSMGVMTFLVLNTPKDWL